MRTRCAIASCHGTGEVVGGLRADSRLPKERLGKWCGDNFPPAHTQSRNGCGRPGQDLLCRRRCGPCRRRCAPCLRRWDPCLRRCAATAGHRRAAVHPDHMREGVRCTRVNGARCDVVCQHPGHLLTARDLAVGPRGRDSSLRSPPANGQLFFDLGFHAAYSCCSRIRTSPSCTTETTSSPVSVKTSPRARPRAPYATGDSCAYSSHRSARNGR
jgi:hypothetical protein